MVRPRAVLMGARGSATAATAPPPPRCPAAETCRLSAPPWAGSTGGEPERGDQDVLISRGMGEPASTPPRPVTSAHDRGLRHRARALPRGLAMRPHRSPERKRGRRQALFAGGGEPAPERDETETGLLAFEAFKAFRATVRLSCGHPAKGAGRWLAAGTRPLGLPSLF